MTRKQWLYWLYRRLPTRVSRWGVFWLKPKFVIGAVALVPDREGRLLVLHHTYRKRNPWRLPGGLKERHESPFATVEREVWEEANIRVKALRVVSVMQAETTFDVVVLCELLKIGPFLPNAEVDDVMWIRPGDPLVALPEGQMALLDWIMTDLVNRGLPLT